MNEAILTAALGVALLVLFVSWAAFLCAAYMLARAWVRAERKSKRATREAMDAVTREYVERGRALLLRRRLANAVMWWKHHKRWESHFFKRYEAELAKSEERAEGPETIG